MTTRTTSLTSSPPTPAAPSALCDSPASPTSPVSAPSPLSALPATPPKAVLRCTGTADFLAVLPFLTGFTDENSLFVVLFRGVRGEDVMRIDLPDLDDRVAERALVTTLIEVLRVTGAGAESPAVVCATGHSFEQRGGAPFLRLLRTIERRCAAEGWRLRELAVIASDGWAGLLDVGLPTRRDLDEIASSPLTAEASELSRVQPLASVGQLPQTDPTRLAAVTTQLRELRSLDEVRGRVGLGDIHGLSANDSSAASIPTWVLATSRVAEACLSADADANPHDIRLLARLIEACQHPASWFVVARTMLTDTPQRTANTEPGAKALPGSLPTAIDEIEDVLTLLAHAAIDPARLRRAATTLGDAAAHAPENAQPAVFALIAWVWWMLGMQSVALRFVQQALRLQSGHDLTHMVERLTNQPPQSRLRALREGRVSADAQPEQSRRSTHA